MKSSRLRKSEAASAGPAAGHGRPSESAFEPLARRRAKRSSAAARAAVKAIRIKIPSDGRGGRISRGPRRASDVAWKWQARPLEGALVDEPTAAAPRALPQAIAEDAGEMANYSAADGVGLRRAAPIAWRWHFVTGQHSRFGHLAQPPSNACHPSGVVQIYVTLRYNYWA